MSDNDLKLNLILKAADGMSDVVKSACRQSDKEFEKLNKTLENAAGKFDKYGKKAAVFGGALVAASGVNVKVAADFEQGMNNVSTLIDTNTESIKDMSKEILQMASKSPKAISDLAEGLYSIRSAGISADDQFKVLHGSEMLSVAGLSSTAEAVDIATSAINAFNLKGEEQNKMYDTLFKVVKFGKTNMSEFAQGFGSTAGVVASAGIKLDEYSAAVAAMTTTGLKANNAHTQMSAAISALTRSSKEQVAIFRQLGAKSFKDLVQKSGGMVNAFKKIERAVGGNEAKMVALMGSINGYKALMGLTNTVNGKFNETLSAMRDGSDLLSEAYEKQAGGLNNQMNILKNNLQGISIRLGEGLLPVVKAAAGGISKLAQGFNQLPDGLVNFISISGAAIGALTLVGGTGAMAIGGIIRNVILLRKVMRASSIATWANPAILPVLGVSAAVAGLGIAAVICYKKFEGFRNVCQGTWAVIKAGGAWLAVLWNSFLNGASAVWGAIGPAAKFGLTIISWIHPIGLAYHATKGLVDMVGKLVQKAGGLRGIGSKLTNWANNAENSAKEVNEAVKGQRVKGIDGSHAQGLDYVPYDGYIAQTHEGEAILNKQEADSWRKGSSGSSITIEFKPNVTINGASNSAKEDFMKILRQYKNEIANLVGEVMARNMARSY